MKRTYQGGCHCGAVRFEADIDVDAGTWKCNCTICGKGRMWTFEAGPGGVRLLKGQEQLADYTYRDGVAHHYFCRVCGIRPYEFVSLPLENREYYNVSVPCVEGVDLDAALAAPIHYVDGLHDDWNRVPDEIRHL